MAAHETTPGASADYEQMALTGLDPTKTYKVTIDGQTTEMTPNGDGTLPIDDTWLGKKVRISVKATSGKTDSVPETLDLTSKTDLVSDVQKAAEDSINGSSEAATDGVKSVKTKYIDEVKAITSDPNLTYKEIKDKVSEIVKEGDFEVKKEEVIEDTKALTKECSGKDLIDGEIQTAVDELTHMDYKTSTKDDLEKVYTDTKEKVDVIVNKDVLPNRLTEQVTDLTSEYPYTDESKDEIQQILTDYTAKIKAATTSTEQQSLYTEALDKIKEVKTGEAKTSNQSTTYPSDYDYDTSGLIGTVSGDNYDANSTLTITINKDSSGDSKLKGEGISEDYVADIGISSNETGSTTGYNVSILLPSDMLNQASYKVIASDGSVIDASVDANGYLTFQAPSLGSFRLVSDYQPEYLRYVSLPLLGILLLQFCFVIVYLKKESKKDEKGQERK